MSSNEKYEASRWETRIIALSVCQQYLEEEIEAMRQSLGMEPPRPHATWADHRAARIQELLTAALRSIEDLDPAMAARSQLWIDKAIAELDRLPPKEVQQGEGSGGDA